MPGRNHKISLWDLRLWLVHHRLSVAALARRLGTSRSAIYYALKGKCPRTLQLITKQLQQLQ